MQRLIRIPVLTGAVAALAGLLLAGCNSDISLDDFNVARRAGNFVNTQALSFSAPGGQDFSVRSVTQADLIGPQGQCAAVAAAPAAAPPPDAASDPATPPLLQSGIALQMTECEVVSRAGQPDNIEFGANERGERAVVLTYTRGPRPGIYRFAGGRLASIERGAEPPAPAKKAAPAKKKRQPT